MKNIRNFSIIAHIDHGKSTLSDRIIQICGGLSDREMEDQVLDSMDLERERGFTIKSRSVTLNYKAINGRTYQLNFIDTPGHVDFSYEVSRSLAACEGALLVVDAGQGVQAQTIANYYTAMKMNLKIVPIINKIDLPSADIKRVTEEIKNIIGIDATNAICCSAKTGFGVTNVLEHLIHNIQAPEGDPNAPLQALIIDSWFDNYLGVVALVRIKNGTMYKGDKIKVMGTGQVYDADRLGVFTPRQVDRTELKCGEVGWLVCAMKNIFGAPVGDTLTALYNQADEALPGFKKVKPQVFAGLFSVSVEDYESFREALGKLSLNDASLYYEPERSTTLGLGFRCGFLGLLHMEIIQERLKREYHLKLITTAPTVVYEVYTINKEIIYVDSPSKLPLPHYIKELREPIVACHMLLPQEYLGSVIKLCVEKRGTQIDLVYYDNYVSLTYEIPMAEVVLDFFDRLKSVSHGYSSLDYNFKRFQVSEIVRVDILINGECVDALSLIIHKNNANYYGRKLVEKMKVLIPRQQFDVIIQATINNRVIARSKVKQLCKNVLARCHGGDVSRKRKLLQKQKEGKKRMKRVGSINLPQELFFEILHVRKNSK